MAKVNLTVARIQGEIKALEDYGVNLQNSEPQAYQNEKSEIESQLVALRVQHLEAVIEVYKEQNPVKYEDKKDALEAKMEFLKQGGDTKSWDYGKWKKIQSFKEAKPVTPESKSEPEVVSTPQPETEKPTGHKCESCEFTAKNKSGLRLHTKAKHS